MAAEWDHRFLEESGEYSEKNNPRRPGASTGTRPRVGASSNGRRGSVEPSPSVLEPAERDSSLEGRRNPGIRTRLTESLDSRSSETSLLLARGQMNGHMEEREATCCSKFYNCYKSTVVLIRNSACLYILQLLFSSIPVSAMVMGTIYAGKCPKLHSLPVFSAVLGLIGVLFMVVWMYASYRRHRGTPMSDRLLVALGASLFVLVTISVIDAALTFNLYPKYDPSSKEYCNETFYTYAWYKEIATAVVVVISGIIYCPGARHIVCCQDCSRNAPPMLNYYAI